MGRRTFRRARRPRESVKSPRRLQRRPARSQLRDLDATGISPAVPGPSRPRRSEVSKSGPNLSCPICVVILSRAKDLLPPARGTTPLIHISRRRKSPHPSLRPHRRLIRNRPNLRTPSSQFRQQQARPRILRRKNDQPDQNKKNALQEGKNESNDS